MALSTFTSASSPEGLFGIRVSLHSSREDGLEFGGTIAVTEIDDGILETHAESDATGAQDDSEDPWTWPGMQTVDPSTPDRCPECGCDHPIPLNGGIPAGEDREIFHTGQHPSR